MISSQLKLIVGALALSVTAHAQTLSDSYVGLQWGLKNSGTPQSIELDLVNLYKVPGRAGRDAGTAKMTPVRASKKVIVAVLDTGVDVEHPDLKGSILWKDSECKALEKYKQCVKNSKSDADETACNEKWVNLKNPEVDQDKNGYPMDCHGWSILPDENRLGIKGSPDFGDTIGHGTHVAGIIAATRNNGIGIAGLSENILILPVQVLGERPKEPIKPFSLGDGGPFDQSEKGKEEYTRYLGDYIARGVIYAVNSGAQVINFSLGWPANADSEFLRKTIKESQKKGVIFVAAAGNDSTRALLRPCTYEGVICVGAHGADGALTYFSNYGTGVDIAAPGSQILSTYPLGVRNVRFLNQTGFEYLHGTSQATPFVSAAIGEMLARGIPAIDVLPRLLAGARTLDQKLPIMAGPANDMKTVKAQEHVSVEKKWILTGALDLNQSLSVAPREIIRPVSKEKQIITWDRQSSSLSVEFSLTNIWSDVSASSVNIAAKFLTTDSSAVRPRILSSTLSPSGGTWKRNEIRKLKIQMQIVDSATPAKSRIPSHLDFVVNITSAKSQSNLILEAEVIVPISTKTVADETYTIEGLPQNQVTYIGIDENYDRLYRVDYLISEMEGTKLIYHLFVPDSANRYREKGVLKVSLSGEDSDYVMKANGKPEFGIQRLMWQGKTFYAMGIRIDRSEDEKPSEAKMWLLDSNFAVVRKFSVISDKISLPLRLFWTEVGGMLSPVWLGKGIDPAKKPSLVDNWENQGRPGPTKRRVYYYDAAGGMKSIDTYQGMDILDILDTNLDQRMNGSAMLLLGKNHGTEVKPSYLVDYSVAFFKEEKLNGLMDIRAQDGISFTNLAEGTQDRIMSLDKDQSLGTSWAMTGKDRNMLVTSLVDRAGDKTMNISPISPLRGVVDGVLYMRSAFAGGGRAGGFAFTNSEIQYHDFNSGKAVAKSWERYTFYSELSFAAFHFPLVLSDRDGGPGYPALYLTEAVEFSRGVTIKTVQYNANGPVEIVAPAKLRFQSGVGCKPIDNPVRTKTGVSALDYRCGDKILRMKLEM